MQSASALCGRGLNMADEIIPNAALNYIKDKKLKVGFSYKDVWNEEHVGRQRMQFE